MKVSAQSLRKGNVVEVESKLYVILFVESFYPGKGTPTTKVDMRRISDGIKVSERWRTTEMVERAILDESFYSYLYQEQNSYIFMNTETYEQVTMTADMIGDRSVYLQPEMQVKIALFEGSPVSIELPQKVTLEVAETEPVTKGQTAASSYKRAILSNGVVTSVPPHVAIGSRVVIYTEDGSYDGLAK